MARPFRILSLSGGGFLGLYTAAVLQALEQRAGMPLARRFDLVAGTSIGGVLALALAYELPMAQIVRLFVEHGSEVFSSRALPGGAVSRLVDLGRSVLGSKYAGDALHDALAAGFGNRRRRMRSSCPRSTSSVARPRFSRRHMHPPRAATTICSRPM